MYQRHMGVSKNHGTPKSLILIGFSIINHPFWGTPIFGNTHIPPGKADPWKAFATVIHALNDLDLDVRREAVAALGDVSRAAHPDS